MLYIKIFLWNLKGHFWNFGGNFKDNVQSFYMISILYKILALILNELYLFSYSRVCIGLFLGDYPKNL